VGRRARTDRAPEGLRLGLVDGAPAGTDLDHVAAPNTVAVFLWGPDNVKLEFVEHKPGFSLV
jgi:hypothetical protein